MGLASALHSHVGWGRWREFELKTLVIESEVLRKRPWGVNSTRHHILIIPRGDAPKTGWPVVWVLGGFASNPPFAIAPKFHEVNLLDQLEEALHHGRAPRALYLLVDAMTPWGGGQFINSEGQGNWRDHLVNELVPAIGTLGMAVRQEPKHWCVMGGSSGGYGALQLASDSPNIFGVVGALAPDAAFELSLMPDILSAAAKLRNLGGVRGLFQRLKQQKLDFKRDFDVLNAVAMGLCYAPAKKGWDVHWPIDTKTGEIKPNVWRRWLSYDPLVFLNERSSRVRQWHACYLSAPSMDQFKLQFAARRLNRELRGIRVARLKYSEFSGTHFDLGLRRPILWEWLSELWRV